MFKNILDNNVYMNNIIINAKLIITESRKQLTVIYKVIEDFVRNNSFIISRPGLLYETSVDLTKLDAITIFCDNIFRNSNKLINLLCEELEKYEQELIKKEDISKYNILESEVNPRWLILRTTVAHEEINIFYDGRPLVIFKAVKSYKNIPILKMFIPMNSTRGIFTNEPLLLLPPELELMDIYHQLYSPDKAEFWQELSTVEYNLYEMFIKRKKELVGGAADCQKSILTNIETIKRLVVLDFIRKQPIVLIGDWATKLIEFGETGSPLRENYEKVQLIIDSPIENFNEILENFLSTITQYKCTYREEKLHTVDDGRLKKYTFYIGGLCNISGEKTEKPFIDVYNSASYELVPYRVSAEFNLSKSGEFPEDIKIGNVFVLLRFMLFDVWILRIIKNLGLLTANILENKINKILDNMANIKTGRKYKGLGNKKFQKINYLGTYESLLIYQKNKLLESKFPSYVPFYYKEEHGKYREI